MCIRDSLKPSSGKISLGDDDITDWTPDRILRSGLALVPEHRRIFADLTVNENLLVGGVTKTAARRIELRNEVVELFPALSSKLGTSAGYLSGGEAQQLAIGRAMMAEPQLLLLDEPTLGLDRLVASTMARFIREYRERGKCIILSTHIMSEVEKLCDRIGVIHQGRLCGFGTLDELRERTGCKFLEDIFMALMEPKESKMTKPRSGVLAPRSLCSRPAVKRAAAAASCAPRRRPGRARRAWSHAA